MCALMVVIVIPTLAVVSFMTIVIISICAKTVAIAIPTLAVVLKITIVLSICAQTVVIVIPTLAVVTNLILSRSSKPWCNFQFSELVTTALFSQFGSFSSQMTIQTLFSFKCGKKCSSESNPGPSFPSISST